MRLVRSVHAAAGHWICSSCRASASLSRKVGSQSRSLTTSRKRGKLPDSPARARFAPSPTGSAHLGSLRTALFNYLLARKTQGQFLLRLEDTDQKRTIPGAEQKLYDDLRWAGLHWDEGPNIGGPYGPYRQSERISIYQKHLQDLLKGGNAYRCFCSSERLDELNRRRHDKGLNLGYDRKCAHITAEEAADRAHKGEVHVVRFRSPEQWPRYDDLVYGKSGHGTEKTKKLLIDEPVWEDAILVKSDGFPTYHWANVCDDHDMKITHVVRGAEWMSSTPLHVALYDALAWEPPFFSHVPLLVDHNRQKLSKRNFESDVASFKKSGIFPEALTNFAALLGWSHERKSDVMSLRELEELFDLKITKGNTIVSFDKLNYLQEQHARRRVNAGAEQFEHMIRDVAVAMLEKYGAATVSSFVGKRQLRDVVASMLRADSLPYLNANVFAEQVSFYLTPLTRRPPLDINGLSISPDLRTAASTLCLVPEDQWTKEIHRANLSGLQNSLRQPGLAISAEEKLWKKELYHYLRWALLGGAAGPSIPETMEILGRDACVKRIQSAALETKRVEMEGTRADVKTMNEGADVVLPSWENCKN